MALALMTLRWFIGAVFLLALLGKVRKSTWPDLTAATRAVVGRTGMPIGPVAVGLVVAELACVVLIAVDAMYGLALALGLLITMNAGLVTVIRRSVEVSCPCFGVSPAPIGVRHVVRNGGLAAAALAGVLLAQGDNTSLPLAGTVIAGAAGILAAGLIARLDDIIDLFSD